MDNNPIALNDPTGAIAEGVDAGCIEGSGMPGMSDLSGGNPISSAVGMVNGSIEGNERLGKNGMDGEISSPYFDKNGVFLGVDEKGFEGEIFITSKNSFEKNSKNGIANSKTIQADKETKSVKNISVDLEAQSKIYTFVLKQSKEFDLNKLFNGEISIFNNSWDPNRKPGGFNSPHRTGRMSTVVKDGIINITVNKSEFNTLFSVELIINNIGVHEFTGHGIKLWGDKSSKHYKTYQLQKNHWTFNKLPLIDQTEILDRIKEFMKTENPTLFKKTYK